MTLPILTTAARTELSVLTRLALPLAGAQLAQMAMGIVDTVMAGRLSAVDLAGVALGGAVMWPASMLMMGMLQAVTPTVAQLNGARRVGEIGEVIRQALFLAAFAAVLVVLFVVNARPYYNFAGVDPAAIDVSVAYLRNYAWGVPAAMAYFVLRYMAEGMGFTRPALYIVLGALTLKIPLNLVFMHGYLGAPALGGSGCGLSTAVVLWLQLGAVTWIVTRDRFAGAGLLERFSLPDPVVLKRLLAIGLPIGATVFFEVTMFSMTTLLIGRLGAQTVAAHVIAMNLGGIAFMVPLAFGMAGSIRVGFNVGAEQFGRARQTALMGLLLGVACSFTSATLIMLFRGYVAALYTTDLEVAAVATSLMLFVALFQFFDGTQSIAIGTLRGYKDTRVPMIITLCGYWVLGLPLGSALGFGWFGPALGIYGFWTGLTVALAAVAGAAIARLLTLSKSRLRKLPTGPG